MLHCVSTAVSTSKKRGDYVKRILTSIILLAAERVYKLVFFLEIMQGHITCRKQVMHTGKMRSHSLHSVIFLYFVILIKVFEKAWK